MSKVEPKLKFILASVFVFSFFVTAYLFFTTYQPKSLQEVREVKGYQTSTTNFLELPYPRYAKALANDSSTNSKKYTFQTEKTPQEIQDFYANILPANEWKIKKQGSNEGFLITEYKKDNTVVVIWSSYDQDIKLTFASVEITLLTE